MAWHKLAIGMLLLLATGCSRQQEEAPAAKATGTPTPASAKAAEIELRVAEPATKGCVELAGGGALPANGVRWEVAGATVADQHGRSLCRPAFRRNDQIVARIGAGDGETSRTLAAPNAPPLVTEATLTVEVDRLVVAATATDADDDSVDLHYQWFINGESGPLLTEAAVTRENYRRGDRLHVRIVPNDGFEDGAAFVSRELTVPNTPPAIVSRPPERFEAHEYSYQAKGADADGDQLTYALDNPPAGMAVNPQTGLIAWPLQGVAPGTYAVNLLVRDTEGGETRQEFTLTLGQPASR